MACEEVTKYFPNLALGWNPTLPPRAMDPDNGLPVLFTDSLNYVSRDGRLQRRPGVAPMVAGFQFTPWFAGDTTEKVMWCATIDTGLSDYSTIAVTNYRIMIRYNKSSAWKDCTPTYSAGTVTATNGSTIVTGSGTQWSTLKIGAFSKIAIAGVDYLVVQVNSDTSLNIHTGYAGSTGAGKVYTITRFFNNLDAKLQFYGCIFNFSLYVAGDFAGGSGNVGTDPQPAVVKVANFNQSSSTSSYITAKNVISVGLDACSVSSITGIQALQDGRIVISGVQDYIFYSSLLNDAVWTSSPGGFTQVVLISGRINALGRLGNNLTLHHNAGIVFGYPTGQTDPPLGFQASSAKEGCFSSSTLKTDGVREFFVTTSGAVKQFDGSQVEEIGAEIRPTLRSTAKDELSIMFGGIDADRGDYYLAYNPTGLSYTYLWKYSIPSHVWHPLRIGHIIRAFSDGMPASDFAPSVRAMLGLGLQSDSSSTSFLATFDEALTTDTGRTSIELFMGGGIFFVTDDIDFGDPRSLKVIRRIILWADQTSSPAGVSEMMVSGNNGASWVTAFGTFAVLASGESVKQFCFDENDVRASTQFRVKYIADSPGNGLPNSTIIRPLRMLVIASKTGEIDFTSL